MRIGALTIAAINAFKAALSSRFLAGKNPSSFLQPKRPKDWDGSK